MENSLSAAPGGRLVRHVVSNSVSGVAKLDDSPTSAMSELPSAGVYHDVSFEEYTSWEAMNISKLTWGAVSMEHLKAALDGLLQWPDSTDKKFGRAIHCRLLEPDRYKREFLIASPCSAILKSGPRSGQKCGKSSSYHHEGSWTCGQHSLGEEPVNYISVDESLDIEHVAEKVRNHDVVKLLRQQGGFEASVVSEIGGVKVKARVDKLIVGKKCPDVIVDVKKVQVGRGGEREFAKSIINYRYHQKAAWYVDIVNAVCGVDALFFWVVIEDSYPHSIGVYMAHEDVLAAGRSEYQNLLDRYKQARESGKWLGYSTDIVRIGLPGWYQIQS